jgi:hypothetical protein
MSQEILTLDPASFVPCHENNQAVGPVHTLAWLIVLAGGIACLIVNWIVHFNYLPHAPIAEYGFAGALDLELHILGCTIAGIAVGISPKVKAAMTLSILVLVANLAFYALIFLFGPFTSLPVR